MHPKGKPMLFQSHTTAKAMTSRYASSRTAGRQQRSTRPASKSSRRRRVFRPVIRPAVSR